MVNEIGKEPHVITLASGKGGVGKSFLAANIAVHLSKLGRKVILFDADLAGANLHSLLGLSFTQSKTGSFSLTKIKDLNTLLIKTGQKNLQLLSPAKDRANIAKLSFVEKIKLMKGLKSLETDFLVIDTASGTYYNTLDFFLFSPHGILITVADPLSIENLFYFIKCAIIRKIKIAGVIPEVESYMRDWMSLSASPDKNLVDTFIHTVPLSDMGIIKKGIKISLVDFKPILVINQARTLEDRELGLAIQRMVAHYFGIDINYLGHIDEHQLVRDSILEKKPLVSNYPKSKTAKSIENIVNLYITNCIGQNEQ